VYRVRFGIQPPQFADVMSLITGERLVDFTKFNFPQICMAAVKKGFHFLELTLDIGYVLPGSLNKEVMKKFVEMKNEEEITYSVHLPLWSIEPSSPNEYIRKASVKSLIHSIEVAKILEPECYVLHSTGALAAEFTRLDLPKHYKELVDRYMLSHAVKSIEEILSKTGISPCKLALEDVEFPFKLSREIVDQFTLSICFDTGHLLAGYSGEYSVMGFLKKHWDRIVEIHLHDGFHREKNGDVVKKDHLPIGSGDLRVSELMGCLDRKGFKGPVVFELGFDEAKHSLEMIREQCPKIDIR